MAELIRKEDTLNQGREKLNEAIKDAETAKGKSESADVKATQALAKSESTQTQLDTIVIEGDSSVEAAQARVDEKGERHTTLKDRIDDGFTSVWEDLNERGVNVTWFRHLITERNVVSDPSEWNWTPAIQAAINTSDKVVLPQGTFKVTESIKPKIRTSIEGSGVYTTIIKGEGSIRIIDWSSDNAKSGAKVKDIAIIGDGTVGQVGIDALYLVNNTEFTNIRIENCDVGARLSKIWYGSFDRIFAKNNITAGIEVLHPENIKQVNGVVFKNLFISGSENNLKVIGSAPTSSIKFESCTFEASKKTSILIQNVSPISFDNCYFERNFMDATKTDVLTWSTPIDIKVTALSSRNLIKITNCYFSRRGDFIQSSEKTSIYLGDNVKLTLDNNQFQCGTSNYIDANIYSTSHHVISEGHTTQDGYARSHYIGALDTVVESSLLDANLRYSSSSKLHVVTGVTDRYFLNFIPSNTTTTSTSPVLRIRNKIGDASIMTVTLPDTYSAGIVVERSLGTISAGSILYTELVTGTEGDLNGTLFFSRKQTR